MMKKKTIYYSEIKRNYNNYNALIKRNFKYFKNMLLQYVNVELQLVMSRNN